VLSVNAKAKSRRSKATSLYHPSSSRLCAVHSVQNFSLERAHNVKVIAHPVRSAMAISVHVTYSDCAVDCVTDGTLIDRLQVHMPSKVCRESVHQVYCIQDS